MTASDAAGIALVLDYGERRIGMAVASAFAGTANPLDTLHGRAGEPDWFTLDRVVAEWQPTVLVIGLPYNADGSDSPMTTKALAFAATLAERYGLRVDTVDERLTSAEAESILRAARQEGRRRKTRKGDVDRVAATLIAESWLRSTNKNQQE